MLNWILFKKRLVYYLYCVLIVLLAYVFDRHIQMIMFIVFFELIQGCFKYRFHADTLFPNEPIKACKYCKIITFIVEIIFLIFCKELDTSYYLNIFIIMGIAFLNTLLEFCLERLIISKSIFQDKEKLLIACKEAKLSELETKRMIMKYIEKKKYSEIAIIESVEDDSIRKSIVRARKKLKEIGIV